LSLCCLSSACYGSLCRYSDDFTDGSSRHTNSLLNTLEQWLRGDKLATLRAMRAVGKPSLKYFTYDWSTNAKNAKNFSTD